MVKINIDVYLTLQLLPDFRFLESDSTFPEFSEMIPVLAVLKFTRSSQNAFDAVGHKRHKIYEMDFTSASEMQQSWGRERRRLLSFENIYWNFWNFKNFRLCVFYLTN